MVTNMWHRLIEIAKGTRRSCERCVIPAASLCLVLFLFLVVQPCSLCAQGVPFIRNYSPDDYHGHHRNYAILALNDGTVFVANFEGLLYFDNAEWHMLHTPDIANMTALLRDHQGVVWAGGYNYLGRVVVAADGRLALVRVGGCEQFNGEVQKMWQEGQRLLLRVSDGAEYQVADGHVQRLKPSAAGSAATDNETVDMAADTVAVDVGNHTVVTISKSGGLTITQYPSSGTRGLPPSVYQFTEANGLCSNNVTDISYNGHGLLWGATDVGLFTIAIPSCYTRFTASEGLGGEVLSIANFQGVKYAGTTTGLYRQQSGRRMFQKLAGIDFACWQLLNDGHRLLVATANGIYSVLPAGTATQLTDVSCTALFRDGDTLYCGQSDGVWRQPLEASERQLMSSLPYVNKMYKDSRGTFWLQNIYGHIYNKQPTDSDFRPTQHQKSSDVSGKAIVPLDGHVAMIGSETEQPVSYPLFSQADSAGMLWLTNREGRHLYCWQHGQRQPLWDKLLAPLGAVAVRAVCHDDRQLWIGHEHGITIVNAADADTGSYSRPQLHLRTVRMGADSVLWGGFSEMPTFELPADVHSLSFAYGVDFPSPVGVTLYRYRLNDGQWSAWSEGSEVQFNGISYGRYRLSVEALLANGDRSDVAVVTFSIAPPFYLRWYMQLLYVLLLIAVIYTLFLYRLHLLRMEKQRLENTVRERTAEVVSQRDEILRQKDELQAQSLQLQQALDDLGTAQQELIRSEKMATVGKLTKGLVDRILNPLNYITNYSKLSGDLLRDLRQNVEDEGEKMSADNYADTLDLLGMLGDNLQQVDQFGQNTARVVKAMGEILREHRVNYEPLDMADVVRHCHQRLLRLYADAIELQSVTVSTDIPDQPLMVMGNGEQLIKAMLSIIANAFYAFDCQAALAAFRPQITISVAAADGLVIVTIANNGIDIEPQVRDKVFDPFFTTKPTSEAVGVGLYICREVVQNHHGDIVLRCGTRLTEFVITLPLIKD